MKRTELREHIFKMLFQIEFNEMDRDAGTFAIIFCKSGECDRAG